MHIYVGREDGGTFEVLTPSGRRSLDVSGLAELEHEHHPRWVFASVERDYPALVRGGLRLNRCHDLSLAEGLLLAYEGRGGPRGLAAALARANGLEPPPDEPSHADAQPALFEPRGSGLPPGVSVVDAARTVLAEQERRIRRCEFPDRMRLLVAAESASALAAAEMSIDGLPWRPEVHDELLTELLGPRVPAGQRPKKLVELAARVSEAFGGKPVNPDSPATIVRAFGREGISIPSARAHVIRKLDHPAVPPLLEYRELSRLHSANGWAWLDEWVHDGRFRPAWVVGGVVSGRWASQGGGALQIPKTLRVCVRADPGWKLVAADAAQLEPRILTALSGDRRLAEVSASTDLYARLAEAMFPSPDEKSRGRAKIAMLSAMYGGTAGEAASLLALLRQRFPDAVSYVERAARAGERGERVRSRLGRTSPAPSEAWRALTGAAEDDGRGRQASRNWGRFTRNFVVQASAADFMAVMLATLRRRLPEPAHLVFFQHDEVIVHTPDELAEDIPALIEASVSEASALLFGPSCPVHFPMHAAVVNVYADAK
ncbi:DNA polymerase-1 [Amycolatopsis bartoniae]|uniref:DNA-directed DNA polymerase n=1 Tax=Amycolatopsis bartoniae TaxID=941986 RepID=A0A8H9MFM9_9PSEU|nr:bifunctional 3'-5' exonuclease/DNA polymerase [Amycolatopsis bartoniae]MBB2934196.1 DNA polymerase-1 [Amycolatopsis bartoniae]TVT08691.1 bifunctional 3'-5' exonuclease/DNA polymerase [Amycolatopsis bartoniae]GHF88521.1 DNA polymerase I [Amycolatopsis bartoniae]